MIRERETRRERDERMKKKLKDLSVAEVACFLRDERLKVFVDMVVEEEVRVSD